jgi:ribosomal protein S7
MSSGNNFLQPIHSLRVSAKFFIKAGEKAKAERFLAGVFKNLSFSSTKVLSTKELVAGARKKAETLKLNLHELSPVVLLRQRFLKKRVRKVPVGVPPARGLARALHLVAAQVRKSPQIARETLRKELLLLLENPAQTRLASAVNALYRQAEANKVYVRPQVNKKYSSIFDVVDARLDNYKLPRLLYSPWQKAFRLRLFKLTQKLDTHARTFVQNE